MGWTFVNPDTKRLPLGDDMWIEVKLDLNAEEQQRYEHAGLRKLNGESEVGVDWVDRAFTRVMLYLTDWNAKMGDDKDRPCTDKEVRKLDGPLFEKIEEAIKGHIAARAEEKKALNGNGSSIAATS